MILGIDHIGLATGDPDGVARFLAVLGLHRTDRGVAADYGVACEFWGYANGRQPAIEVVSPLGPDSSVSGRLERAGPGLYHLAFAVDDLAGEMDRLRREGFSAVHREPCRGARPGMRVAFMYLRRPACLLVELVEQETQSQQSTRQREDDDGRREKMGTAGDPAG
jgi:methylmalonyl-CoA/ethylmalonyl-CoA epimerase